MGIGSTLTCHLSLRRRKARAEGYPEAPSTLGQHLRKRRMDLGLLQKDVARRIGSCGASVWLWESERAEPELKWMPGILDFLGYDPAPTAQSVGARLVQHRTRLGWTQKRLAEELRVDQTTLARWETGKRAPWGEYSKRIAAILVD